MADRLLLLLLLSGLPSVICESLESIPSSPVVQEAGTTLDLSCKGSGYNFGSYYTHWIRQPAGKPLEWIGYSRNSAESVKGRIKITDDDPNSVVYLKLSALKAEDTAVYYCAREGTYTAYIGLLGRIAFDLWGKGTQVTVIGDKKAPAYLFPLLPCGTKGGFVHLGCMASDFSPADSLSFSWKDSSSQPLQDSRQYPLLEQNGVNVGVSEIRVTAEDWEKKKPYQCTVTHPALPGGKTVILEKPGPRINISILPDLNEKEFMLECHIVTDFFPSEIYVGWRISDDRYEAGDTGKPERTGGRYTVISRLKVSKENWNKGTIYSCFAGLGSRETDKVPTMKTVNKMTGNSEEISM